MVAIATPLLQTHIELVRKWLNRPNLDAELITWWHWAFKTRLDRELRVREMIKSVEAISDYGIPYPDDCLEILSIRYGPSNPENGDPNADPNLAYTRPFRVRSLDQTFTGYDDPDNPDFTYLKYTIDGNTIVIGPATANGKYVQLFYYARVPELEDYIDNWMWNYYWDLYMYGTLAESGTHLVEDDRVPMWQALATDKIAKANSAWITSRYSGSPLKPRYRSFG